MARSWQEVKADKAAIDRANGRDVEAMRVAARHTIEAYMSAAGTSTSVRKPT